MSLGLDQKNETKILDGKALAEEIQAQIKKRVVEMQQQGYRPPHLAAVLVGENPASMTYVRNKVTDCKRVNFESTLIKLPKDITQEDLLGEIQKLNQNNQIDGFIVQLPLPKHIDAEKIIMAIDPDKDVDGFHPVNFGKMALDMTTFLPATPYGILAILEHYNIDTKGKHTVVIGRSRIVGKPMSILMGRKDFPGNATVTLTHSYTDDIIHYTRQADILITALGVPKFLKDYMIKKDAVVIDVGITRIADSKKKSGYSLVGDVDQESIMGKAAYLTPVPGGVGPMTRTMLLKNTLFAAENRNLS